MKNRASILLLSYFILLLSACSGSLDDISPSPASSTQQAPSPSIIDEKLISYPTPEPVANYQKQLQSIRSRYEHSISVVDSWGRDITDCVIDLWIMANEAYNSSLVFDVGRYISGDGSVLDDGYYEALDFHEVMDSFFTEQGKAQAMSAMLDTDTPFFVEHDSSVWVKSDWGSALIPRGICEAVTTEITDSRILLEITFDELASRGIDGEPLYQTVEFAIRRINNVWYVDYYEHPQASYPAPEVEVWVDPYKSHYNVSEQVVDLAADLVRREIAERNAQGERDNYHVVDAELLHVENTNTVRRSYSSIEFFSVDYRIKVNKPDNVVPEGALTIEDRWITLDEEGAAYLMLYYTTGVTYELIGEFREAELEAKYGTAEKLAMHGDMFTAAAYDLYCEFLEESGLPEDSPRFTDISYWMLNVSNEPHDLQVVDANGTDITDTVIELWERANAMYHTEDDTVFRFGWSRGGLYGALPDVWYEEISDYEDVVRSVFSDVGALQLENAWIDGAPLFVEHLGVKWRQFDLYSSSRISGIPAAETVSVEDGRIELLITCDVPLSDGGDTVREQVPFVIVETDAGWRVESYEHPCAT